MASVTVMGGYALSGGTDKANASVTNNDITLLPPVADFSFPPGIECGNVPIAFTNKSVAGDTYLWNFGDPASGASNTSTLKDPEHRFVGSRGNGNQNFTVTLTVTDAAGVKASKSATVVTKQLPDSRLGGDGETIYQGLPYFTQCVSSASIFQFSNQSSTKPTNTSYKIIWGDGTADFEALTFTTQNHTYNVGKHLLTFIVRGQSGCIDTAYYNVFVGRNPGGSISSPSNTQGCTGETFSFPFANIGINPLGTVYIVSVNDGTKADTFQHPAPAVYTHTFNKTSCGAASNNSFTVTYSISNPCGETPGSIGGIKISQNPTALFSIAPNDTACVNSQVLFVNTSPNSFSVSPSGTCTLGKVVWKVSPATGWTISSGFTGDDLNGNAQSAWTAGTNQVGINFTAVGNYTVKMKIGNAACGIDSIERIVCINPRPTAAFTVSKDTGCAPFDVTATSASPTAMFCGTSTYEWSVNYVKTTGCLPDVGGIVYLNGTNQNSFNPQFRFLSPGIYTISLTVRSPGNACFTTAPVKTIVVKGKPSVAINAPLTICVGQPLISTLTSSCYITQATYAWSFPGGNPASSTFLKPDTVRYAAPGSNVISVSATNECGTTDATKTITINDLSKADAGPDLSICGNSATMAANTPVAGTGTWSKISGPAASIVSTSAPNTRITGLVAGTYVFSWRIANGSCIDTSNITVFVSPNATPANAGPDQSICVSNPVSLAGNSPAPGTGAWTLVSGPNTPAFTNAASPTTTVTGLVAGTYVFKWSVSSGTCPPGSDDVQINISGNVTTANAGPLQNTCSSTATMKANAAVAGNGLWTKLSGPASSVITTLNSPSTTITGLVPGTYIFRWTITNGTCSSFSNDTIVVVSSTPATAGPDQTLCSPADVTLTGNAPGAGTGRWTLVSGPNTPAITNASLPVTSVTGLTTGNYLFRWTLNNGSCPPASDDLQINIVNLKASFSPQNIVTCNADTTVRYNSTTVYSGSDALQYKWLADNTVVSTGSTLTHRYAQPLGSTLPRQFNTWLIVSNSTGCTDTAKGFLTMQQAVKASFELVSAGTCGSFAVRAKNTSVNANSYKWMVNGVQVSTAETPDIQASLPSTSYTVSLIADNGMGCRPDTFRMTFVTPSKPRALFTLSDSAGCSGSLNVSVRNMSTGAISYTWMWGDGSLNSNADNPAHVYNAPGDYMITLIASNGNCNDTAVAPVRISARRLVDFSVDKTNGCDSITVAFTNLSVPAGNSFWEFGDGTSSTQTNPVKRFAPRLNPYSVKLLSTNLAGCRDSVIKINLISARPSPAASFLVTPRSVIEVPNYIFNFLNTTTPGNSYAYTWDFGDGSLPGNTRDASHKYNDTGRYVVSLTVYDNASNCTKTVSQTVQITGNTGYLYVPNAFQPASTNPALKYFLPVGRDLCSYRLQIFTTWGQKVFETKILDGNGTPTEGWNGQFNAGNVNNQGKGVQQDSYVWRIDATVRTGSDCNSPVQWKGMKYPGGSLFKRVGTITLLR